MDVFGKIPDWLKLPPSVLLALIMVAASLLFLSDGILDRLGATELVEQYRSWIGLVFLIASALFMTGVGANACPLLRGKFRDRQIRRVRIARLQELTPQEKAVLAGYLAENTRTQILSTRDGVVAVLADDKIICRLTRPTPYMKADYKLHS